ncbi:MAG: bifunctional glutamate N-acetyltransferase/amino-acid acetyltransferase ArgJ [Syntrophaceae bacterium]|nr:bifunctional glutamate N-acetyltransferase/amino-acid acetyltransferase ArgJ [Syntrophaceae bacterium]
MSKDESLTVPGFRAAGIAAGIKENGRKDLALIVSDEPAAAAGLFTTNTFKAAPVILDMERIRSGRAQAILTNSGNANAANGPEGVEDARASSRAVSEALGIPDDLILVASTGVIGRRLPVGKILAGIRPLAGSLRPDGMEDAQEAILTTDRFPKMAVRVENIDGRPVTVLGMAKGAGMIQPNMATLLSYVLTDAAVDAPLLEDLLREGVSRSFNAITVDGCMSTNDTVLILANGRAGNRPFRKGGRDGRMFRSMLSAVLEEMALAMVRDGEGATKIVTVEVLGGRTKAEARRVAYAVGNSNLFKTACFGGDPNWGRVIQAVGASGVSVDPDAVDVSFGGVTVFSGGRGIPAAVPELAGIMAADRIHVRINLSVGRGTFSLHASDLTFDYVKINAHYTT